MEQPVTVRPDQFGPQLSIAQGTVFAVLAVDPEPGTADFQRADRFLQRLLERAPDAHGLADRFHLRGKRAVRGREFFKGEPRDLGDHIVDRGFETGGSLPRDVVDEFVQGIADRELGGDLGDREAGGFRGQRARTGHARIHFNDDHAAVARVYAPLHVRSAGLHADRAHHVQRGGTHPLIFPVGQGLRRRHRDAVARMHAHRIHVFDRTHDHCIVFGVAHDFELEFLPADQRFFDQNLGIHAGGKAARDDLLEFIHVVRDAAAGAAERETRTDDQRHGPDIAGDRQCFVHIVGRTALRQVEPDRTHGLLEQIAVFRTADHFGFRADHFHPVTVKDAGIVKLQRQIQRGLAPQGRQDRVRPFPADDLMQNIFGQRFDISAVRKIGVGHDRGGIAVDQQHFVALFLERFAGLGSGIIEFAGLSDDDRA